MLSRDFCYFLQGYFEIISSGKPKDYVPPFYYEVYKCIENHLNLVFKCEEYSNTESYKFCIKLQTILEFNSPDEINDNIILKIRESLNNVFIHEIDNTFTGDKVELQQIHDGDKYHEKKAGMRC